MRATTISSWAQLVARALQARGIDAEQVFAQAGLDINSLRDPNARYGFDGMRRLWELATETTADPDFGLAAARQWHPTAWHALGYAWLASATLREAFERVVRYGRMVSDAMRVELVDSRSGVWLVGRMRPGLKVTVRAGQDAALATLVVMARISSGRDFRPLRVRFAYPRPDNTERLAGFFRAPCEFDSDMIGLELATADLDRELPTGNAELARVNEHVVVEYLARFDRDNLSLRVRTELLRQLPSGHASEISVAEALNITPRTMQRRLRSEQTTYSQLVDETRCELARQYVRQSDLSINEITYLLGFSEPSNFSRAFKRWTGRSPSASREQPAAHG